jgi:hypothetical protein
MRLLAASVAGVWLVARAASALAMPPLADRPAPVAPPPAGAAAPAPSPAPADAALAPRAPPPAGRGEKYVGVVPGGEGRNPLPPAKKASPHLIWSGFQSGESGSRVFFQTNLPVTFEVGTAAPASGGKPGTVSVFLRNCRIHLRNNSRHLDTRFFPTPVEGVTALQRRKDVELRISLKQAATVAPHTEAGPDGTRFLVLDFPPGQPVAADSGSAGRQPAGTDPQK